MNERLRALLGIEPTIDADVLCFLPWTGEFGWYLMTWVKRIQAHAHPRKWVFCRRGHECLFPSAQRFFCDWPDPPDVSRAGVGEMDLSFLERPIRAIHPSVAFADQRECGWEEKTSLAPIRCMPQPLGSYDFDVDIVIAPRRRQLDPDRNLPLEFWQDVVRAARSMDLRVAICGRPETTYDVRGADVRSWDHGDVDPDAALLRRARLAVVQESGLAYLAYACRTPVAVVDHCHHEIADLHRDHDVPFVLAPTLTDVVTQLRACKDREPGAFQRI